MGLVSVGCCGFPTSKASYCQTFPVVEVNTTFYGFPKPALLEKWRREAPGGFEFTVKANQLISHVARLKPTRECVDAYRRMLEVCRILKSKMLLIQTPASLRPGVETFESSEAFFNAASVEGLDGVGLAWETRGPAWQQPKAAAQLKNLLQKHGVTHVTDPLVTSPVWRGEVAYFRLHGSGPRLYYYEYSDAELLKLREILESERRAKRTYAFFNNLTMLEDATRFKTLLATGQLLPAKHGYGVESIRQLLMKAKFPATKSQLIRAQGWRLVHVAPGKQLRLSEVLTRIRREKFANVDEVANSFEEAGVARSLR